MSNAPSSFGLTPEMLKRFSIVVPRYTSYPTVPEWQTALAPKDIATHFQNSPVDGPPLSIYVHLPFCMRLCLFCGCNMIITQKKSRAAMYLDHLEHEIEAASKTPLGRREVAQMHWGGGTPTYLSEDELSRLNDMIRSRFKFRSDAEVGIEADPRETSKAKVAHLGKIGFNRLSMGVQDFDPEVQKAVQRIQPEAMTRETFDAARAAGMRGLNIDLMYGLPLQSAAKFEETLEAVLRMRPDRIALFHYAHLPAMIRHQKAIDEAELPSSDEKYAIFCNAADRLTAEGYDFIGLDHFAVPDDDLAVARRDGTLNRNFQGYTTWKYTDLLGFGVTAISNVGNLYVQNQKDLKTYEAGVDVDGYAPMRGFYMSPDDILRRDVIYQLMCQGRLSKAEVSAKHKIAFDSYFADEMKDVAADAAEGLATIEGDRIVLTHLGVLFMRNVARRFDKYLRAKSSDRGLTFSKSV